MLINIVVCYVILLLFYVCWLIDVFLYIYILLYSFRGFWIIFWFIMCYAFDVLALICLFWFVVLLFGCDNSFGFWLVGCFVVYYLDFVGVRCCFELCLVVGIICCGLISGYR